MRKFGVKEIFSDDWRQSVFWLCVASFTLIAGFTIGWAWRDRPAALGNVRILDVLTAIGTLGATVGAVSIAAWQNQIQKRYRRIEAIHALAGAYPRLSRLVGVLTTFRDAFAIAKQIDQNPIQLKMSVTTMRSAYIAAALPDSRQLIDLSEKYAADLSIITSQLTSVLEIAANESWARPEDRRITSALIVRALDVVIPRLEELSSLGHDLIRSDGR